jgi:uncharacterized delta-60 repeat protein
MLRSMAPVLLIIAWAVIGCDAAKHTPRADASIADTQFDTFSDDSVTGCFEPGTLDPSFADFGLTSSVFGLQHSPWAAATSVALDRHGNLVVGGSAPVRAGREGLAVVRLTPSGALDSTFGTHGIAVIEIPEHDAWIEELIVDAQGAVIFAGARTNSSQTQAVLGKLTSDGVLDETFGTKGLLTYSGAAHTRAVSIAVDPGGRYAVAIQHSSDDLPISSYATVTRYLSTGQVDVTYAENGETTPLFGNTIDEVREIVLDEMGRILIAGHSVTELGPDFAVARLLPDGSRDPGFGDNGLVLIDAGGNDGAAGIATDGHRGIVVLGSTSVLRIVEDGSIDFSFGQNGILHVQSSSAITLRRVGISIADDKVIAVGWSSHLGKLSPLIVRLEGNGILDVAFGINGLATISTPTNDLVHDFVVDADGRLVTAGSMSGGSASMLRLDFRVSRVCG